MSSLLEVDFAQPDGFRPLSLDLRIPDSAGAPLIVFLHGGGWLRGSRKVFTPGISDSRSFDRIVGAGFAIASCEYRLSGEARFPAQLDDVDAALAWLHDHTARYGVDASRIVLWGVSAGATLAALTGLRRDDVRGVVDWFGPADLFSMAEHDMGDLPEETREARWIGGPAAQHPEIARRASPTCQVHADAPPFHIAHGTADEHVPFEQSERLADALRDVRADVEFRAVAGAKHFWQDLEDTDPLFDSAIAFATRVTPPHSHHGEP
ncbi:alpha/beta hydrolase [Microbacterium trichothecenolyticum]|uniref:alpha/beta hydrolase n=1 Tax=Microbacterium trichothecenolyticum TaxID=69370 RepID=UPI001C6DE858|nr:alpha/beta hydrolase [Microbacterium trichothecenolyticum]MBW9121865.1 alpha/beta hydrolase [Microbacterium trichothecenolyticum]